MNENVEMQWKPIMLNGESTQYEISEYGNVRNINTGKILTPVPLKDSGRLRVLIYKNGIRKDMKIHRLVYEAFYGPIPKNMSVDHIDANILNNHFTNLRLLTPSENVKSFRRNHPEFLQVYPDDVLAEFYKKIQRGIYYKDAADRLGINKWQAYSYLVGRRRHDLWEKYQPFPSGAYKKITFDESEKNAAIRMIVDGTPSYEILKQLDIEYNECTINYIYRLRKKLQIKDPKYFDTSFIVDIDRLILDHKTNAEIYKILNIELTDRISWLMARRRIFLNVPNDNTKNGNNEEIKLVRQYIAQGFSNNEILEKIGKERNQYYINLFGKERKKYKALQNNTQSTISTTIETVAMEKDHSE